MSLSCRASGLALLARRAASATPQTCGFAAAAADPGPPHDVAPPNIVPVPRNSRPPLRTQVRRSAGNEWTEVCIKDSGEVYYWNERTGETTAVGEPRPGPLGRVQPLQPPTVGGRASYVGLVAVGAGFGLIFGLIGKLLS